MLTLLFADRKKVEPTKLYYGIFAELLFDVPVLLWLLSVLPLGAWVLLALGIGGCWVLVNVGK